MYGSIWTKTERSLYGDIRNELNFFSLLLKIFWFFYKDERTTLTKGSCYYHYSLHLASCPLPFSTCSRDTSAGSEPAPRWAPEGAETLAGAAQGSQIPLKRTGNAPPQFEAVLCYVYVGGSNIVQIFETLAQAHQEAREWSLFPACTV